MVAVGDWFDTSQAELGKIGLIFEHTGEVGADETGGEFVHGEEGGRQSSEDELETNWCGGHRGDLRKDR